MVNLISELIVVSVELISKILHLFLFQFNMLNDQSMHLHGEIFIFENNERNEIKMLNTKKIK